MKAINDLLKTAGAGPLGRAGFWLSFAIGAVIGVFIVLMMTIMSAVTALLSLGDSGLRWLNGQLCQFKGTKTLHSAVPSRFENGSK